MFGVWGNAAKVAQASRASAAAITSTAERIAAKAGNAASRGPSQAIAEAVATARAAGKNPSAVGNDAHKALNDWVKANKPGWRADKTVPGSASKKRPDIRTQNGRNIDLKPNTPSGRKAGRAKVREYERLGLGRTRIIYY